MDQITYLAYSIAHTLYSQTHLAVKSRLERRAGSLASSACCVPFDAAAASNLRCCRRGATVACSSGRGRHLPLPLRRGGGSIGELGLPPYPCYGTAAPTGTCACPAAAAKAHLLFTHQMENMIPELQTTSPMRKSRIAMMVSMELASSWTTTQEKQARALDRCRRNMVHGHGLMELTHALSKRHGVMETRVSY